MLHISPYINEPDKSNEVLIKTHEFLEINPNINTKISELGWAYYNVWRIIPITVDNFFSGHNFPFSESWEELQISFNLASFGLYKQAFMSLRSGLELGLLSVYYNINDEGHETVRDWLKSKDTWEANTPKVDKIWKILNSNKNINEFNSVVDLRDRFNKLSYLHNYIHTKGYKYSNRLGIRKSNWQTFEEKLFLKWLKTYEEIVIIIITLHLLKYPIGIYKYDWDKKCGIDNPFPVLESFEIDRINKILPNDYLIKIMEIADKDEFTQNLYRNILELPDMSEDDIELQIINMHKSSIEDGMGFIEWEKNQLKIIEIFDIIEKNKALKRIEDLKKWSIEKKFMNPKFQR